MALNQRKFIEAVIEDVRDAKEVLLPVLLLGAPEEPWTAEAIRSLRVERGSMDPLLREAVDLVLTFELPFVEEEERLAALGVTLAADMASFEIAMVRFERAFWEARFAEYEAEPGRWAPRERPTYDVCVEHRLDSDRVRRAIRDHGATSFEEVAPLLGTSPTCSTCHVGVTRLLIHEVRRQKGQPSSG